MLAKPAATLPADSALPGGTVYEPKWDGYRAILERTSAGCRVWSRNGADLAAGFPEIVQAAREQLEPGTVIDGELVVWRNSRLDFGALAPRLAYRGRRRPPEGLPPVSLLAFRSEEHTSELQSLMRISYAVYCLQQKQHTRPQLP